MRTLVMVGVIVKRNGEATRMREDIDFSNEQWKARKNER